MRLPSASPQSTAGTSGAPATAGPRLAAAAGSSGDNPACGAVPNGATPDGGASDAPAAPTEKSTLPSTGWPSTDTTRQRTRYAPGAR